MLPSVRKDLEELEARLDTVLNKQLELEELLAKLRADLSGALQNASDDIVHNVAASLEAQSQWLASALSELRGEIAHQCTLDKTEILAAIAASGARNQEHFGQLQTRNDELAGQLAQFEAAWRERVELEIDDVSPPALRAWSEKIGERLKRFAQSQGMARAFAWQLLQELKELRQLYDEFDDAQVVWENRLDDLARALFSSERALPWTCLTPHNSTPAQRRELRALETAIAQLRSHCQEQLRRATGIAPLEIVPRVTPFDAGQHESNEFLEVPTTQANQHNLILSVEKMGFSQTSDFGAPQLLRPARVRRYVLQHSPASIAPIETSTEAPPTAATASDDRVEAPPVETTESEMPRVSGQL